MKVVGVIPMKLNNERLPNKNTKLFTNGEPLCSYILETLLKVKEIDEVYVFCSNPEIKKFIPKGVKYLERSESLDTSATKMNEVLKAFSEKVDADIYVMSHATAPFITKESISQGLNEVMFSDFDSALSVLRLQGFFWRDNKPLNYDLKNIPRTQDLEPFYEETSGFYIFEKEVIKKHNRRIGYNPCLIEVNKVEAVDIDEAEDFNIANAIFNGLLKNQN